MGQISEIVLQLQFNTLTINFVCVILLKVVFYNKHCVSRFYVTRRDSVIMHAKINRYKYLISTLLSTGNVTSPGQYNQVIVACHGFYVDLHLAVSLFRMQLG